MVQTGLNHWKIVVWFGLGKLNKRLKVGLWSILGGNETGPNCNFFLKRTMSFFPLVNKSYKTKTFDTQLLLQLRLLSSFDS